MDLKKFNELLAAAAIAPNVSIKSAPGTTPAVFPYYDMMARSTALCVAFVGRVEERNGTDVSEHTVVVSYHLKDAGEEEWGIWCSDKFVEGRDLSTADAKKRCEEAAGTLPNRGKLVDEMMKQYGKQSESGSCNFWTKWRREKELCPHTTAMLAHLRDTVSDLQNTMIGAYQGATSGVSAAVVVGDTYSLEELAFKVPVLFEGDRGAGKTVQARAFARENKYHRVEYGGHNGTESPDLLGYTVQYKSEFVWKDGPVAEAFRRAAKGQKTVLILDELLRIPQREQSLLLTALSPDEGMYRIRTGRVLEVEDGVAREEELECPVENLCVIATTNVGAEYGVDEYDPALAERWVIIRKDTNIEQLKVILKAVATAKKFPAAVATKLANFFLKMVEAQKRGLVARTPTTRTLVRAIELAETQDDVRRMLKTQLLLWVARTSEGQPVTEQVDDVQKIIEKCFIAK